LFCIWCVDYYLLSDTTDSGQVLLVIVVDDDCYCAVFVVDLFLYVEANLVCSVLVTIVPVLQRCQVRWLFRTSVDWKVEYIWWRALLPKAICYQNGDYGGIVRCWPYCQYCCYLPSGGIVGCCYSADWVNCLVLWCSTWWYIPLCWKADPSDLLVSLRWSTTVPLRWSLLFCWFWPSDRWPFGDAWYSWNCGSLDVVCYWLWYSEMTTDITLFYRWPLFYLIFGDPMVLFYSIHSELLFRIRSIRYSQVLFWPLILIVCYDSLLLIGVHCYSEYCWIWPVVIMIYYRLHYILVLLHSMMLLMVCCWPFCSFYFGIITIPLGNFDTVIFWRYLVGWFMMIPFYCLTYGGWRLFNCWLIVDAIPDCMLYSVIFIMVFRERWCAIAPIYLRYSHSCYWALMMPVFTDLWYMMMIIVLGRIRCVGDLIVIRFPWGLHIDSWPHCYPSPSIPTGGIVLMLENVVMIHCWAVRPLFIHSGRAVFWWPGILQLPVIILSTIGLGCDAIWWPVFIDAVLFIVDGVLGGGIYLRSQAWWYIILLLIPLFGDHYGAIRLLLGDIVDPIIAIRWYYFDIVALFWMMNVELQLRYSRFYGIDLPFRFTFLQGRYDCYSVGLFVDCHDPVNLPGGAIRSLVDLLPISAFCWLPFYVTITNSDSTIVVELLFALVCCSVVGILFYVVALLHCSIVVVLPWWHCYGVVYRRYHSVEHYGEYCSAIWCLLAFTFGCDCCSSTRSVVLRATVMLEECVVVFVAVDYDSFWPVRYW